MESVAFFESFYFFSNLTLFTVYQYLFCANSIVCYSFRTRPNYFTEIIYFYLPQKNPEVMVY